MRRWHAERNLMLARWRLEIGQHDDLVRCCRAPIPPDRHGDDANCHCYRGPGFMRKRRPYGCGNPRCAICHYGKLFDRRGRADERRRVIAFDLAASGELGSYSSSS